MIGNLDFFASATTGDGFDFTPIGESDATATEDFDSNNQSKLSENGPDDLVELIADGPGNGQLPYVGLKGHEIGVRSQGDGSGTPASRVDADEMLTIELGPDVPGEFAWYAQIALSAKFNADILVEALDGNVVVDSDEFRCSVSDCGPDSGGDRVLVSVGASDSTTLFTSIRISISPNSGGAASIIDDPASVDANLNNLDTYFEIVEEYEGVLECNGAPAVQEEGQYFSSFKRLNVGTINDSATGCAAQPLKPYNDDIVDDEGGVRRIQFEPEGVDAVYRGELTFPAGTTTGTDAVTDFLAVLEYDEDGPGPLAFVDIKACGTDSWTSGSSQETLAGFFSDKLTAGLYPVMPGGETSCVVYLDSTIGGEENWVLLVYADPWFR